MRSTARWAARAGALLLLISPFLPQARFGGRACSAGRAIQDLSPRLDPAETLAMAVWLFAPAAAGAVLMAGAVRREGGGTALRGFTVIVLLAAAFGVATLGSVLLTPPPAQTGSVPISFPLALALFGLPILLAAVAFSKIMGAGLTDSAASFARVSLGVLAALNGTYWIATGWTAFVAGVPSALPPPVLIGAWAAPLGGLLAAAGEGASRIRPRAAVDMPAPSG